MRGAVIVVSRNRQAQGGKTAWAAECAGLLPFVSETGETPRAAVVRFLRRVTDHYERQEQEPLPETAVTILSSRQRVTRISAISTRPLPLDDDALEPTFRPISDHPPLTLTVTRRRVGSWADETWKTYRYTDRRWGMLGVAYYRLMASRMAGGMEEDEQNRVG